MSGTRRGLAWAVAAAAAVAAGGGGCARGDDAPRAPAASSAAAAAPRDTLPEWWMEEMRPDPTHALFGCIAGDSAIYGDLRPDPVTGDTAGVLIALWRAGDGIDGAVATAIDPSYALPLTGARLFARDSIALDLPHLDDPAETSRFVGRASCTRLWGRQRTARDAPTRPTAYHRVLGATDDDRGEP